MLGRAKKVSITKENTTIVDGAGQKSATVLSACPGDTPHHVSPA
jgi:chaperonin GroEL (HSP60 family)